MNWQANTVLKIKKQIELQIKFCFDKRKCKLNCKANYVLKKEMQIELQSKYCFEKGNAN